MQTLSDVEGELRMETQALAHDIVRLEMWAREAYRRRRFERVGELHHQREEVREHRSDVLRQLFQLRLRRRR